MRIVILPLMPMGFGIFSWTWAMTLTVFWRKYTKKSDERANANLTPCGVNTHGGV